MCDFVLRVHLREDSFSLTGVYVTLGVYMLGISVTKTQYWGYEKVFQYLLSDFVELWCRTHQIIIVHNARLVV